MKDENGNERKVELADGAEVQLIILVSLGAPRKTRKFVYDSEGKTKEVTLVSDSMMQYHLEY